MGGGAARARSVEGQEFASMGGSAARARNVAGQAFVSVSSV